MAFSTLPERRKLEEALRGGFEQGRKEAQLEELTSKGQSAARNIKRAHILLLADEGLKDKEIARALSAATTTVERICKRFVEEGLEVAISERPRPGAKRSLNGHQEAYLIALWLLL